jgi:tetratricopeptide (TPR) repeat protein
MPWTRSAALLLLLAPLLLSWPRSALTQPARPAGESPEDKKSEAEARFYKGRKLSAEGAFRAALAEFQASRKLYPGESAEIGAAACFRQLQRFHEALDLFELALRDFSDTVEAKTKALVQREVVELRFGLPLGKHVELNAGLELPVLFAVSPLTWSDAGGVHAGPDGYGWFSADALLSGVLVTVAPTVGVRFDL